MKNSREERWRGMYVICISPLFLSLASFEHSHLLSRDNYIITWDPQPCTTWDLKVWGTALTSRGGGICAKKGGWDKPPTPSPFSTPMYSEQRIHSSCILFFIQIYSSRFIFFPSKKFIKGFTSNIRYLADQSMNRIFDLVWRWLNWIQWSEATHPPPPSMIG